MTTLQGNTALCLHDLSSLSPKPRFFARSGPPFVIRSVLIGWGCPGSKMVDLTNKTEFGGERGEIEQTQNSALGVALGQNPR